MEPISINQSPIIQKQTIEDNACLKIPYDTRPFKGQLQPNEEITLHGNITIVNDTNQVINLRIQFTLPEGYHLYIQDSDSNIIGSASVSMQATYAFIRNNQGQFELNLYRKE